MSTHTETREPVCEYSYLEDAVAALGDRLAALKVAEVILKTEPDLRKRRAAEAVYIALTNERKVA